ncbi:MAG: hypothetical protein LCH54_02800 [Bacteroidetes bacterium]|nr:hypothetical protein [Bacteroidota bacterium]
MKTGTQGLKKLNNQVAFVVMIGFILSVGLSIAVLFSGKSEPGFHQLFGGNLMFYPFFFLISLISSRILYVLEHYRDAAMVNLVIPFLFAAALIIR